MTANTKLNYSAACYQRYLRHCDIYKLAPLTFYDWMMTA